MTTTDPLVSTEWLAANLGKPGGGNVPVPTPPAALVSALDEVW